MSVRSLLLLLALGLSAPLSAQGLTLDVTQPGGPGSFQIEVTGASAGAELFNFVSLVPALPTGSGPLFGLGLGDAGFLIEQFLTPLATHPFHVNADGAGEYLWGFTLPPAGAMLDADLVSVEWSPTLGPQDISPVVFVSLDL